MKLKEAWEILELSPGTSPEEVKKQYRNLSKRFHPDVNKDPGAEDKFKKINEAYQCIQSGKGTDREERQSGFGPFQNFYRQQTITIEPVNLFTEISFKDSVLGCKKEFKFNRKIKCNNCDGNGEFQVHNGCDKCGGQGRIVSKQGNMVFARTCDKCYGKSQMQICNNCDNGIIESESSISVNIPGGVQNNNILRLGGMGNFIGSMLGMEQYTDAHLHISVIPDADLTLSGNNVHSKLDLSLLEALQGCKKTVKTIVGIKEIEIKPLSKNNDEITISNLGVNKVGNHCVFLNVIYPKDTDKLINYLKDIV